MSINYLNITLNNLNKTLNDIPWKLPSKLTTPMTLDYISKLDRNQILVVKIHNFIKS